MIKEVTADMLLQISSWFNRAAVVCKDAAISVLNSRRRRK